LNRYETFSLNIFLNFLFIFHLMLRHALVAPSRSLCRFQPWFRDLRSNQSVDFQISLQSLYSLRGLEIITGLVIFCLNISNILCISNAVTTPWTSYAYKATQKVYIYRIGNPCLSMWKFFLFPGIVVLVTHSGAPYRRLNYCQLLVKYVYVAFVQFLDWL
jgi:hypothetical protein